MYADPDGLTEVSVGGFVVDVVKEHQIVEIQTAHFYAIRQKLYRLIDDYKVKLVYPIATTKWLIKIPDTAGGKIIRRKSPKKGKPIEVFNELVGLPKLIHSPNFTLELVMVELEEIRTYTGEKTWRNHGWTCTDRRLIRILQTITLRHPADFLPLLPENLPEPFTTADIANCAHIPRRLAQKCAYSLSKMGTISNIGKKGRSNLYRRSWREPKTRSQG